MEGSNPGPRAGWANTGLQPQARTVFLIDYQEENYRMLQQTEPTPILGKIIYNQNQAGVSLWSMVMKARIGWIRGVCTGVAEGSCPPGGARPPCVMCRGEDKG